MKRIAIYFIASFAAAAAFGIDNPGIASAVKGGDSFALVRDGRPVPSIIVADGADSAVKIAARNLAKDFERVTGAVPPAQSNRKIVVRIDPALKGRRETYVMKVTPEEIVISGSDRRGAVYGIYELSEQLGVSPWYDWADAPLPRHKTLSIKSGTYTNGEPAVRYRGIFLNDEAPCLTGWVKNTYGTDYGDHRFYERVGELILRLRGNFLWPAMWCWAYYADDPENIKTMDEMGVIMGTSHHEPMARNHQEYARRRKEIGAWNYKTNKDALDKFFAEGIRRMKDTEDVVTIGMRGDGDVEMDGNGDMELMKSIIANQRAIIERETGKGAAEVPQVWALYKEVQDYFDKGLRPPEDVTILLCDDNWGNVRLLPRAEERNRAGGWGMYYHVDYVGAPRNSKFINVTSAASMWEQMSLAYEYGVDRLWVLNVGDLKPMEYPIALFLDMAWNPTRYTPKTLHEFTERFCAETFALGMADGPQSVAEVKEAARILDLSSRYACRCTPELLNTKTYDLASGEWAKVMEDYAKLAKDAEAQYARLPQNAKDAYFEIVLFHVKAMANLYEMYYSQAMNEYWGNRERETGNRERGTGNRERGKRNLDEAINGWADLVETLFRRHGELCDEYNLKVAGGKWNGMMKQKVIGYTSWNDGFPCDMCPKVKRAGAAAEESEAAERAAKLLDAKEPRIYSIQRSKSYDSNMGENWWMRRHDAILERLKTEREFDLVLAGDSITHRWERHGKDAYVQVTNELKVLNLGFGADCVKNLLWRFRSGELDGYRAKAVQLMIGTNNGVNEPSEETAAQIRACLREIRARQPQAKILLCPILPRGNPDSVERGKNDAVNELLKPLCDGKAIVWTDWSGFFTLDDGRLRPGLNDDGLHPNAKGYAAWAKVALPVWKAACGKGDGHESIDKRREKSTPVSRPTSLVQKHESLAIEANHYTSASAPEGFRWEFIPGLGYGEGAMEVFPRLNPPTGAKLVYKVKVPANAKRATVTVVTRSTLAFARPEGHRYAVRLGDGQAKEVNFNSRLNERPENIYSVFYPTVARRVVAKKVEFSSLPAGDREGLVTLELSPLDPGVAFEKIEVDFCE